MPDDFPSVDESLSLLFSYDSGWGIFVPFRLGAFPHELVYRPTDGTAAIDRIW